MSLLSRRDVKTQSEQIKFMIDSYHDRRTGYEFGVNAAGVKMDQAKKALNFCLQNLNEGDRFEIVRFSTEAEPFFKELKPANKENIAKASEYVQTLKPIGGTAIEDALENLRQVGAIALVQGTSRVDRYRHLNKLVARIQQRRLIDADDLRAFLKNR